jgi:adhesin HecA-like repeat protein
VLQDSAAISITGTPTFPAGSTLVIPEGVSASVGSSVTLTVNGTLTAAGNFEVTGGTLVNTGTVEVAGEFTLGDAGTLTNAGTIEVSGEFTIPSSNTGTDGGTNNGTILVKAGGEIHGNNVTKIGGTGFTVVEAGAKAYFGDESPFIGLDTDTTAIFQLSRGTFSYNNTSYILDGIAKLPASAGFNVGDAHLTLKPGAVLTVANELRIADTSVVDSEPSGTNPAKIVFNSGGKLTFKTDSTSNFYTNAGQLITASGSQTFSSGAQFIWTAISGSTYGWKQQ